jgi:hypothetical protein
MFVPKFPFEEVSDRAPGGSRATRRKLSPTSPRQARVRISDETDGAHGSQIAVCGQSPDGR